MNLAPRSCQLAALLISALAAPATAEGNRLALACVPLAAATEDAAPLPPAPDFIIAPLKTDRNGAGQIEATGPNGVTVPGIAASHSGPFVWTAGTVLHTLTVEGQVADGRSLVLWHRLDQAQSHVPPRGILTKLLCEVS